MNYHTLDYSTLEFLFQSGKVGLLISVILLGGCFILPILKEKQGIEMQRLKPLSPRKSLVLFSLVIAFSAHGMLAGKAQIEILQAQRLAINVVETALSVEDEARLTALLDTPFSLNDLSEPATSDDFDKFLLVGQSRDTLPKSGLYWEDMIKASIDLLKIK